MKLAVSLLAGRHCRLEFECSIEFLVMFRIFFLFVNIGFITGPGTRLHGWALA